MKTGLVLSNINFFFFGKDKMPEVTPKRVTGAKERIWQRTKNNTGLAAKHQDPGSLWNAGRLNRSWGRGWTGLHCSVPEA